MEKLELKAMYAVLTPKIKEILDLGEDSDAIIFKHASGMGDFMVNVTKYVDLDLLDIQTGLKMLEFFQKLQADLFDVRLAELKGVKVT